MVSGFASEAWSITSKGDCGYGFPEQYLTGTRSGDVRTLGCAYQAVSIELHSFSMTAPSFKRFPRQSGFESCAKAGIPTTGTWMIPSSAVNCTDDSHWTKIGGASYKCDNALSAGGDPWHTATEHGVDVGTVSIIFNFSRLPHEYVGGMREHHDSLYGAGSAMKDFTMYRGTTVKGPWTPVYAGQADNAPEYSGGTTFTWPMALSKYLKLSVTSNHGGDFTSPGESPYWSWSSTLPHLLRLPLQRRSPRINPRYRPRRHQRVRLGSGVHM